MSDLIDDDGPELGRNAPEFTVSELSGAVKRTVEQGFAHVRVRGEVGRVSRPRSGHVYLDLKDDRSVLAGVMWKGVAQRLTVQPQEGMEVIATGRLTTFPGQSKYQIVIESIAPAGVGALMAMLEARKKALAAEGLFAPERKRPLPHLPDVIGVVTSPSGAVIRDILHRLRDRFPRRVLVWPVAVQGERCAGEVAAALAGFNALGPESPVPRPDVLIVARGGGSMENLWGFNEEIVVRVAAASAIPVISAVGHETDTTLIDYVADRRAPTPTAAAEMAVPVRAELLARLAELEERRRSALARGLAERSQAVRGLARGLPRPEALVAERSQHFDAVAERLPRALLALARARRIEFTRRADARLGPSLLSGLIARRSERLGALGQWLRPERIATSIEERRRALSLAAERLDRAATTLVAPRRERVAAQARLLDTLSYQAPLRRGYVLLRDDAGAVVRSADAAREAGALEIEFEGNARLGVAVSGTGKAPPRPKAKPESKPKAKSKPEPGGQGSLF